MTIKPKNEILEHEFTMYEQSGPVAKKDCKTLPQTAYLFLHQKFISCSNSSVYASVWTSSGTNNTIVIEPSGTQANC